MTTVDWLNEVTGWAGFTRWDWIVLWMIYLAAK